jgi:hypothetical protein
MDSQPTDKVEGVGDDFVRGGQDKTPIEQKRNSCQRIVVNAGTPTVTGTEGNKQYCAPWKVESPGGTVTTSAYNKDDGKKRCLSAEGGSGDPRRKVKVQNDTFARAHRKNRLWPHRRRDPRGSPQASKEDGRCGPCRNRRRHNKRSKRQRRREDTANDPNS